MTYPDIRERFLTSYAKAHYAEWLAEVGRYVHDCWLREEKFRGTSPLDEDATKLLWDECSIRELEQLRAEAREQLDNFRREKLVRDVRVAFGGEGAHWVLKLLAWFGKTMVEGFVAGIGLIMLGLLLGWIAPKVVKDLRSTVDDVLPADTAPHPHAPSGSAAGAPPPIAVTRN